MNIKTPLKKLWPASLFLLAIASCTERDFEKYNGDMGTLNPDMSIVVAKGKMTVRDFLRDYDSTEVIEETSTGFLKLYYEQEVQSPKAADFISIPDQNFSQSYNLYSFGPGTSVSFEMEPVIDFALMDTTAQLTEAGLKRASFNYSISTSQPMSGTVTISFPGSKQSDGSEITQSFSFNHTTNVFENFDYSDIVLDLTGDQDYNQMAVKLQVQLSTMDSLAEWDNINFNIQIGGMEFGHLRGNLGGNLAVTLGSDSVYLDVFSNSIESDVYFEDPHVFVNLANSFGAEMNLQINRFSSIAASTGQYTNITDIAPISLDRPAEMGLESTSQVEYNTSNVSNLRSLFDLAPKYLIFDIGGVLNPGGGNSEMNDFLTDTSHLDANVRVELPMWGYARFANVMDTIKYKLSDTYEDLDVLEKAIFTFEINNKLPLSVRCQAYFADSNHTITDSLILNEADQLLAGPGTLDATTDKVITPATTITKIVYPSNRLEAIQNMHYIYLKATIQTNEQDDSFVNVRFYSDYYLNLLLSLNVKGKINSDDIEQ